MGDDKPTEPRGEGEQEAKQEKPRPPRFVEVQPRRPPCCPR